MSAAKSPVPPFIEKGSEAREYIYQQLLQLLIKYDAGLITWPDVYFRIKAEPLLSDTEKQQLLRSPSVITLEKLFRGREPEIVIDETPVPSDAVIVAQHSALIRQIVSQYWHLGLRRSSQIKPLHVVSIFKAVSVLARGRWSADVKLFIYSDGSKRNRDLLAVLLILARWQGLPYYSNRTIAFSHELESTVYDDVAARLGVANDAVVLGPGDISERAEKVLCYYVNHVGNGERLREELKTLHGIRLSCCCYGDWWRFGLPEAGFDEQLYQLAREHGISDRHARLIAQWRIEHPADAVRLLMRIWEETVNEEYVQRVASVVSGVVNVPVDMLMDAFRALREGRPFAWPL